MVESGRERVAAYAAARGLTVEFIERPRAGSLDQAASLLGITPADIVKSLVVKRSDGTFLFALIPGDRQISWPKLRALVGVNKLRLPSPEAALEAGRRPRRGPVGDGRRHQRAARAPLTPRSSPQFRSRSSNRG